MASKTESPSPLRRAYFVHGEIYAESASPFPSTPTPPPMSRNTDVLEHLGPRLREWISTWQSTDRGRCIVVMARSSRSRPDLTARPRDRATTCGRSDIRHTVLSRKCRMMRKASEMH
jgi:hypothetical protein